jgi:hypothetical protein
VLPEKQMMLATRIDDGVEAMVGQTGDNRAEYIHFGLLAFLLDENCRVAKIVTKRYALC